METRGAKITCHPSRPSVSDFNRRRCSRIRFQMGTCLSKKDTAAAAPEKIEKEQNVVKKEIFVIKHRRSHSRDLQIQIQNSADLFYPISVQCGRLSRSSSANATPPDFDGSQRSRRRRTPSRERTLVDGSGCGSGRRVSRSPVRRCETPGVVENGSGSRPGKMVSVPASVSDVRRISVRRDVSPRCQSPAQTRPLVLSRSNSRKSNQSPLPSDPSQTMRKWIQVPSANVEEDIRLSSLRMTNVSQPKTSQAMDTSLQPKFIRSRSRSRSYDLGVNTNLNANASSYASILLKDIQKFHYKTSNSNESLTKDCSFTMAAVDMNSTTSSSIDDKKLGEMEKFEFGEVNNDLMKSNLHKYTTMRRGSLSSDMGHQESSGSNSVAGGCQRWGSPSKPYSVESSGWLSSKTNTRSKDLSSPLGFQRQELL